MKQVCIKAYGWCDVLRQNDNYSLVLIGNSKICYNTLGHEFRDNQQKLFQ
jgi:hypothetical protein